MKHLYEITGQKLSEINTFLQDIPIPQKCPVCNRDTNPILIGYTEGQQSELFVLFQCNLPQCGYLFYTKNDPNGPKQNILGTLAYKYRLDKCFPVIPEKIYFSKEIEESFPEFVRIYNQSYAAEAYKLSDIAGIGYRKAVEFLVKDFLINYCGKEREKIEKKFLDSCIKDYIDNPKIKDCAERAVWLGNDEAHYKRKWEEKDVNDLKVIINMLVNFIGIEIQHKNLLKEMPEGRK